MARLSLCLIARDEERMLPGCLASVRGLADEVVLVDTGSTDGTRELAVRAGARVYDRPWDDDFAAPRNLALAHATGEWVLQLDADERLAPGAAEGIRRAMARRDLDLGLLWIHDASSALAALEPALDQHPDGWVLAAAAARALGATAEARLFLARAAERVPAGFVASHRAARHLAMARELG